MWVLLMDAGVDVRPLNAHQVALSLGKRGPKAAGPGPHREPWTAEVRTWDRPLTPSIIRAAAAQQATVGDATSVLAIAPSVSDPARRAADEAGWSVLATNPGRSGGADGALRHPDGTRISIGPSADGPTSRRDDIPLRRGADSADRESDRRGRRGYGAAWVTRLLLSGRSFTQGELVTATGLTQPRVSQTLRGLWELHPIRDNGEVAGPKRWQAADWTTLLDHWLATYPGPAGIRTYWYGLDAPGDSANQILDLRQEPGGAHKPAVSGAVAADRIAPWARPTPTIVYAEHGIDLTSTGLTPARPSEATVELVVPTDPSVWVRAELWPTLAGRRIADPIQVLWDLRHHTGGDADQAFEHLRKHLDVLVTQPINLDQ